MPVAVTRAVVTAAALALIAVVAIVPAGDAAKPSHARAQHLVKPRDLTTGRQESLSPGAAKRLPTGRELVGQRTTRSRTWRTRDGRLSTRVYALPVNYRDSGGAWRRIDDRLIPAGATFVNRANRYRVAFPQSLGARPIRVSTADGNVGFRLLGAHARGTASGASAHYANALPGVSADYIAEPNAVKENLVLASPKAASSFTYALQLGGQMRARQASDGSVAIVGRGGKVLFSFLAPYAYDRAGARINSGKGLSLRLTGHRGALRMKLAVDPAWLRAADRRFPVVIDPGIDVADNQDCYIANGASANTSYCGGTDLRVGYDGTTVYRTLLRFDVQSALGPDAEVLGANMVTYFKSAENSTQISVAAQALTQGWTGGATWNDFDGTNAWTAAGGDFNSTPAWTCNDCGGPTIDAWSIGDLAQQWEDDPGSNYGVLLKSTNETTNQYYDYYNAATSSAPYLQIDWQHKHIGDQSWYPMADRSQLSDRSSFAVNAASGNLVMQSRDLSIAGVGLPFTAERTYNGLGQDMGNFGYGQILNGGWDQWLEIYNDAVSFYDGSGTPFRFKKNGSSYTPPAGIDASLAHNGDGTYTVTYNKSGTKFKFSSDGTQLQSVTDKNNNSVQYSYRADGHMDYATDSEGRRITFGYDTGSWSDRINSITQSSLTGSNVPAATYTYYPSGGPLKTFTDGAGKTTTYSYDSCGRLTQITDPEGRITQFAYDSLSRITSVTRITDNSAMTGDTTTFDYSDGSTVVTDPLGNTTTYNYDSDGRTTDVIDGNGHRHSQSWNDDNQPVNFTSANNQATGKVDHNDYDTKNNLTQNTGPGNGSTTGPQSTWGFNLSGAHPYFPDSATNPQGQSITFNYDSSTASAPNLQSVTQGTTSLASYGYNGTKQGQIDTSTDVNGNTTHYYYDSNHVLNKITPPMPQGSTTLGHDALSRITSVQDGLLQTTNYTYDGDDRVTRIDYPDSSYVTYTYDGDGNVTQLYDSTGGTETFSYDNKNRLKSDSGATGNDTYTYDAADNLKTLTDGGGTVSYAYDKAHNVCWALVGSSSNACSSVPSGATSFKYDSDNNRTHTYYPGSVDMSQTWDNDDRLTDIKAVRTPGPVTLTNFAYTNETSGTTDHDRRGSVLDANNNKTTYTYDTTRGWLTEALTKSAGGTGSVVSDYKFDYDPNGNLIHRSNAAGTSWTSYGYDVDNAICWKAASKVTPDPNGKLTCSMAPTGATTYTVDADGQETAESGRGSISWNKRHQATSVFSTAMGYIGANNSLRLTDGTASLKYNALGLGTKTVSGSSAYYTRDPNGQLLSDRLSTGTYNYIFDGLGSVAALTNSSGTVTKTYNYDPYGTVTGGTGTLDNPWQYAGGYSDSSAGTVKFGERYYDPSIARWTQTDPIDASGIQQGNRYLYAGNGPVNAVDSSGLSTVGTVASCAEGVAEGLAHEYRGVAGCAVAAGTTVLGAHLGDYGRRGVEAAAGVFSCATLDFAGCGVAIFEAQKEGHTNLNGTGNPMLQPVGGE
jgi:RHS repeat-associated protein